MLAFVLLFCAILFDISLAFLLLPSLSAPSLSRFGVTGIFLQQTNDECLHQLQQDNNKEEECILLPTPNPNFNPLQTSLSNILYSSVISGINKLYPPTELSNRNAISRSDGYWKYIKDGVEPPLEFTYGEFDIDFFGSLLDKAWGYYIDGFGSVEGGVDAEEREKMPWANKTFIDIGSGSGRLVLSAAALHPYFKICKGLEILEGLNSVATLIAEQCRVSNDTDDTSDDQKVQYALPYITNSTDDTTNTTSTPLQMAPIQFKCGSFTNPYEHLSDIDVAFVFSSCMKSNLIQELSIAIGRQCKVGTIIITTEYPLYLSGTIDPIENDVTMPFGEYEIRLLEKIDGWCWLMGGKSTAYIHRVTKSLHTEYGVMKREVPQLSLEEEAYKLVQLIESGELTDTKLFMRNVRNDMIFNGVPSEYIPDEEDSIDDKEKEDMISVPTIRYDIK